MKPINAQAAKTFSALVIGQAVCLFLVLWLESQFVLAVADQTQGSNPSVSIPGGSTQMMFLRAGAFVWIVALQTLVAYLVLSRVNVEASRKQDLAADELLRRQNDLVRTRDAVIFGMAKLAESRDPETGDHLERIALYSTKLAKALRCHPRYRDQITGAFVSLIGVSSALHDIGKVGIPDSILLKQGPLTDEERDVMRTHSEIGARCVRNIELRLGGSNFLQMARQIAIAHHERWDGSGYPHGIAGESIPLAARIVALADVYDALMFKRVYKEASSHERTVSVIREKSGSHFDPGIVDVFLKIQHEFRDIAQRCGHTTEAQRDSIVEDVARDPTTNDLRCIPLLEVSETPTHPASPSAY